MSIKKKLFASLLAAVCAAACAFGLAGCFNSKPKDTDPKDTDFETAWTNDGNYHWHAATDGSDKTDGKEMHDWKLDDTKTVEATCAHAGEKVYKCSVCDATKSETAAQLTHKWGETKTVAAKCTERGYEYKECTNAGCHEILRTKELPALGHTASAATCTQASVCSVCKETVAPALGHSFEKQSETQATCQHGGKAHYVCTNAGCTENYDTATSAPLAHNLIWDDGERQDVGTADVCYKIVYHAHCENCEFTDVKTTEVDKHLYSSKITAEATCSHDGEKTLTCSCGHVKTETIAKIADAHIWDNGTTAGGVTTFHCTENHDHTKQSVVFTEKQAAVPVETLKQAGEVKLSDTTIALDQGVKDKIEGNQSVNLAADTLNKDALQSIGANSDYVKEDATVYNLTLEANGQTISELGGYVTVTVPYVLGPDDDPDHVAVLYIKGEEVVEIEGTYANGFVTFTTNHFSYYTVTRMTPEERCQLHGHKYTTYTQEPTCLLAGYELTFCTRCGDSVKVTLPAKGHDWQTTAKAATCTKEGNTHYECKTCHAEYDVKQPAAGHVWTATVYKEATCTKEGNATYKCDNCDETYSVKFAQTAHSFKTTVIEATCTESGHKHNVCLSCGMETDTDFVAPKGHTVETKVVAPECTVDGFTLKYCSVCGEEIDKSNIVKATGHNMEGGACKVCGYGCNHNYVLTESKKPTCTEDGYDLYTCNNCKTTKKDNMQKATGHNFGVDKCHNCGEENPAAKLYYLNLVDTAINGSVCITIKDFTYKVSTKAYEGDELVKTTPMGSATQLDVASLALAISPSGEITGAGYGSVSVTVPDGGGSENTVEFDCKFAVTGGNIYIILESSASHLVPSTYMMMDFDYMLGNMTGGAMNYAKLREYVLWYNADVNPVLTDLINTNSDAVVKVIKFFMNNAFICTEVNGGYNYLLNFDALNDLNDKIYDTKVGALVDSLLGEGVYDGIPALVTAVLNMTPESALEYAAKCGLDKAKVCAAIDSFMLLTTGEKFDSAAMLDKMLEDNDGAMKSMTVADFIIAYKQLETDKATFIGGTVATVTEMLGAYKDKSVYEIVAAVMGQGATAKDLYDMVKVKIAEIVALADGAADVSFTTDKEGNLISAKLVAELKDMVLSGNEKEDHPSTGPSDDVKPPVQVSSDSSSDGDSSSRVDAVLDLTGEITFEFGAEVKPDKEVIDKVNAAKIAFEKNAVITAYSNKEIEKQYYNGSEWKLPDFVTYSRGSEMVIHTDAKGNIVKVVITEERRHRNVYNFRGNYVYCNEWIEYSIMEYEIAQGSLMQVSLNYCGDINMYNYVGSYTRSSRNENHETIYRVNTNTVIKDVINDVHEDSHESLSGGVTIYYNPKTKEFIANNPHSRDALKINREKSDIKCGGYYYVECEKCGYHYNSSIYHLDENYHRNVVYKLTDGAKSCEDGVVKQYVCSECKQPVESYTIHSHERYLKDKIDLKDYGAKCEHTINLYGCACGHYLGSSLEKYYDYDYNRGENWDSITRTNCYYENAEGKRYGATLYTCVVEGCGLNFVRYTRSEKDAHCYATTYEVFVFGVTYDNEKRTATGGTVLDKKLPIGYGYDHNTESKRTETDHGYVETSTCKDCGLKVSKHEFSEIYDEATLTRVTTDIYTHYKNDVNDNTVSEVTKRTETIKMLDEDLVSEALNVNENYSGEISDANLRYADSRRESFTYVDGKEGKQLDKRVVENVYYGNNRQINEMRRETYQYVYVDGNQFEFMTESYNAQDYYDEKGEPSDTPLHWHRVVYDYKTKGYCSPVIYESTQAGESNPRDGEVRHRGAGAWLTQPTCTQCGTQKCAFCDAAVQSGEPSGHKFDFDGTHYVCHECGLESEDYSDGRVSFEDLSYTSQTDYVIGYFNREGGNYSFSIALVDMDNEGDQFILQNFAYVDSNADALELQYYVSGTVSFPVASIQAAAAANGISNYMIRVTFVDEKFGSQLDYSITIDVHDWAADAEFGIDGQISETPVKYCKKCGMVQGIGYIEWHVSSIDEYHITYVGMKNGVEYDLTLLNGEYIEGVEIKNGDIVLKKNYTLVGVNVNGESVSEAELEQLKAQCTLVFNDMTNGTFKGLAFTYSLNGEFVLNGEYGTINIGERSVMIITHEYDETLESGDRQTEYYFEIA